MSRKTEWDLACHGVLFGVLQAKHLSTPKQSTTELNKPDTCDFVLSFKKRNLNLNLREKKGASQSPIVRGLCVCVAVEGGKGHGMVHCPLSPPGRHRSDATLSRSWAAVSARNDGLVLATNIGKTLVIK